MYYYYILLILILAIILFFTYIRIRYKFWALQPVFHVYDVGYLFFPPGIIDHYLPEKNKYTNFKDIETYTYTQLSDYKITKFVNFIRSHYLQKSDNQFLPKRENIIPYFQFHTNKSYFCFYKENELIADKKNNTIIDTEQIIGVITSRPVYISIQQNNKTNKMNAFYVDYLCVHKDYRKKDIAPQLIQTYHYNQRHQNKNIVVNIFKREGELTGIVPLCAYNTYGFSVKKWFKPPELPAYYKILEINPQNISSLHDFLNKNNKTFEIFIHTEFSNVIELIKTKNIFIYVIMSNNNDVLCAYFYRKSCVFIESGLEVLTCIGSINNCESIETFVHGFKISFWKIAEKNNFGFAAIENISHNYLIIHNLMKKTNPSIVSPTAYFFYNFAYPTFSSNKSFILV